MLFQRSIDVDPGYSLPYLGLAKTWILFGIHGLQPAHDVYPRARAAVSKALELDCDLAEAHAAMADIVKGYDWDWVGAEAHYLRAQRLDPQCGIAHQWYANLLSITGRHEEALQHAMKARTLDPLSVGAAGFVAFTYLRARRYREALREAESAVTLEPNSPIANWFLGQVLAALKRFQEASSVLLRAVEQSQSASMYVALLAYVYAESGDSRRASEFLIDLQRRALDLYVSELEISLIYTAELWTAMFRHWTSRSSIQHWDSWMPRLNTWRLRLNSELCGLPSWRCQHSTPCVWTLVSQPFSAACG